MISDMELCRKILLAIESLPARHWERDNDWLAIAGYEADAIHFHTSLLIEAGLIQGHNLDESGDGYCLVIGRLTYSGYALLDRIKDDHVWNTIVERVCTRSGTISVAIVREVAAQVAGQTPGLYGVMGGL